MSREGRKVVLVVDNNAEAAMTLCQALRRMGHSTAFANASMDGYKLTYETRPDVLFLRLLMPGMDGETVAQLIRTDVRLSGTRLVALVDREMSEKHVRLIGFDACLATPFSDAELTALLAGDNNKEGH